MASDLISPAVAAACFLLTAWSQWTIRTTRSGKDVETLNRDLDDTKKSHAKRLDDHDDDLHDLRSTYVSRREFDERLTSSMATINAEYTHIREQLTTHGRWLEFAIFNKKPDQPNIGGV